jgi:hypothetical protein
MEGLEQFFKEAMRSGVKVDVKAIVGPAFEKVTVNDIDGGAVEFTKVVNGALRAWVIPLGKIVWGVLSV